MKELLRSNDPVLLSYVSALLAEEDIDFIVADLNMSVLEGSIGALPRRKLLSSTTSSCRSVAVCMNSTAAARCTWPSPP